MPLVNPVKKPGKDLIIKESGREVTDRPPRTATKPHPRLVNRGGAGLLHGMKDLKQGLKIERGAETEILAGEALWAVSKKDNIQCDGVVVPLSSLKQDPNNAREHPERNLIAIKDSLCLYGQRQPLVVRKQGRVIAAGNGRYQAAKELGWTKIAITCRPMTDVEFAGYGLADNRSAELARWNFEAVAIIDRLLLEAEVHPVGWSLDELEVLRAADWTPPQVEDGEFGEDGEGRLLLGFNPDQAATVQKAIEKVRKREQNPDLTPEECILLLCVSYLKGK